MQGVFFGRWARAYITRKILCCILLLILATDCLHLFRIHVHEIYSITTPQSACTTYTIVMAYARSQYIYVHIYAHTMLPMFGVGAAAVAAAAAVRATLLWAGGTR